MFNSSKKDEGLINFDAREFRQQLSRLEEIQKGLQQCMVKTETSEDPEAEFLAELSARYAYWKDKGQTEYATAYRMLLHNFTRLNEPIAD